MIRLATIGAIAKFVEATVTRAKVVHGTVKVATTGAGWGGRGEMTRISEYQVM